MEQMRCLNTSHIDVNNKKALFTRCFQFITGKNKFLLIGIAGDKDAVRDVCNYYDLHSKSFDRDMFINRIISNKLYCCIQFSSIIDRFKNKKYTELLGSRGLLIPYEGFVEASLCCYNVDDKNNNTLTNINISEEDLQKLKETSVWGKLFMY